MQRLYVEQGIDIARELYVSVVLDRATGRNVVIASTEGGTEIEEVADVTVHIDPEDDELASPCDHLPLRDELLPALREHWQSLPAAAAIEDVTLHYLDGQIHVELVLPLEWAADARAAAALGDELLRRARAVEVVGAVRVFYR